MSFNKCIQVLAVLALLSVASWAQATITCTAPTSSGIATAYLPTGVVPNYNQGTFSTTCTRSVGTDPTTVLLRPNNGANATGVQNRARLGTSFINYETYKDSACSVLWSNAAIGNMLTLTLANVTTAQTISVPSFWACITLAGQVVPAGTYTDTVTIRVRDNTNSTSLSPNGSFAVSITNPATCTITSIADVAFGTYVAFRNTALVSPAANVVMNCTLNLPYTMALDATNGVIAGVGLNYSLALSASGQLRGTGPGQTFTITGTMPSGQAGTCSSGSCSGSDTRTLTITY